MKIDGILEEAVKRGASDVHLTAARPPFGRVKGELVSLVDGALAAKDVEEMIVELLTPPQRARLGVEQAVTFAHAHASARFRGQAVHSQGGLRATFRAVPARVPTLADLDLPEPVLRLAERRAGLVVVAGPAGSGKSTTLAAFVDHVNKTRACHVLTIEDPIEVVHEPVRAQVTQREVGTHVPDAVTALRNATRENADVVLVASLREKDAVKAAVRVASAGVLVLAGVRTNGAVPALECLACCLDERGRASLADALAGVLAQQNVAGNVIHEVLSAGPAVTTAIRASKTHDLPPTLSFDAALERLVKAGKVTADLALEHAYDKATFGAKIGKKD